MRLSSLTPAQLSGAQIALAAVLAAVGFLLLLPRPRGRFIPGGIAFLIAAVAGLGVWLYSTFGKPMPDIIGTVLFILFSLGALGFGTVLVVQRNPARGAIAFAFVILSTCGLFLLLAAPFLMAATIIIYAGAIIVTFLFVLMLSQVRGPSDENDRSREPLFGGLAGFAFTGLVLFGVYHSANGGSAAKAEDTANSPQPIPAAMVTGEERMRLLRAAEELAGAAEDLKRLGERLERMNEQYVRLPTTDVAGQNAIRDAQLGLINEWQTSYERAVAKIRIDRPNFSLRGDEQARSVRHRSIEVSREADAILNRTDADFLNSRNIPPARVEQVRRLREEILLLAGAGELPARNIANLGFVLYADHVLAVELAGTLLLVATVGAVAIAQRRGSAA